MLSLWQKVAAPRGCLCAALEYSEDGVTYFANGVDRALKSVNLMNKTISQSVSHLVRFCRRDDGIEVCVLLRQTQR